VGLGGKRLYLANKEEYFSKGRKNAGEKVGGSKPCVACSTAIKSYVGRERGYRRRKGKKVNSSKE